MTTNTSTAPPAGQTNRGNFAYGLHLVLRRWPALRMAVEMEWAGPDSAAKAQQLEASLLEYFDRGAPRRRPSYQSRGPAHRARGH